MPFLQTPQDGTVDTTLNNSLVLVRFITEKNIRLIGLRQEVLDMFLAQHAVYCLETHTDSAINSWLYGAGYFLKN
jgi:hypothetical protein